MTVELPAGHNAQRTVLLLADRRSSALKKALRKSGFQILETFTTDHAVAVCVNNQVDAVVLGQNWFMETDGWSVAQSVKAVKPNVCVVLVVETEQLRAELPEGVDAMLPATDSAQAVARVTELIANPAGRAPLRDTKSKLKVVRPRRPVPLSEWVKGIDSPD